MMVMIDDDDDDVDEDEYDDEEEEEEKEDKGEEQEEEKQEEEEELFSKASCAISLSSVLPTLVEVAVLIVVGRIQGHTPLQLSSLETPSCPQLSPLVVVVEVVVLVGDGSDGDGGGGYIHVVRRAALKARSKTRINKEYFARENKPPSRPATQPSPLPLLERNVQIRCELRRL
ncbi:hypothetical protein E2C01_045796 [Portunus trituberculatus]|uniref:Uncharacterized protein n=1 Tax=Portunus trituberculatus TaxID=210409 RepID=A0A5B7G434_PORTR|nr:hypothetical protein [Portunus trituberculatus]